MPGRIRRPPPVRSGLIVGCARGLACEQAEEDAHVCRADGSNVMYFRESEVEHLIAGSPRPIRREYVNRRLLFPLLKTAEGFAAGSAMAGCKVLDDLPDVLRRRGRGRTHRRPESSLTGPDVKDA